MHIWRNHWGCWHYIENYLVRKKGCSNGKSRPSLLWKQPRCVCAAWRSSVFISFLKLKTELMSFLAAEMYSNTPDQANKIIINNKITQSESSGHCRLALWLLSLIIFFFEGWKSARAIFFEQRFWANSLHDLICTTCHSGEIFFKMTPNPV